MVKKNKRGYWLRGGVIFGLIGAVGIIIAILVSEKGKLRCLSNLPTDYFLNCNIFQWIFQLQVLSGIVFYSIVGFIIGAVIGWLYGKIKKNKKK